MVSTATFWRIRLMLVDAIDRQTVKFVQWSHPFRVAFGKVIVHRYHVNTISCQSVEEDWQGSHEGLTFTRCHFGNLTLVEYRTAKKLNVVVNHFPLEVVTTCCPVVVVDSLVAVNGYEIFSWVGCKLTVEVVCRNNGFFVLCKATSCVFHDRESNRHNFVQCLFVVVQCFLFEFVYLVENILALVDWCIFDSLTELCYLLALLLSSVLNILLDFLGFSTQVVVAKFLDGWVGSLDFINIRLNEFHIAC